MSQQRYHIHVCLVRNEQPDLENALQVAMAEGYFLTWDLSGSPSNFLDYTRRQIDRCDYVLFVLGDSYGNLSPSGVSYLHLSYVYATTKRKTLFALVKQAEDVVSQNETRTRQRADFASMVEKDQAKYTTTYSHNLISAVQTCLINLTQLIAAVPKAGWTKSTELTPEHTERLLTPAKELNTANSSKAVDAFSQALLSNNALKQDLKQDVLSKDTLFNQSLLTDSFIANAQTTTQRLPQKTDSPTLVTNPPNDTLALEDSVTVNYTAHAYKDGNLSELALRQELMWLDIVVSLRKMKEPFTSDMIQRNLNHLLNGFALPAAKKIQPTTHAVARTQMSASDFDWLKKQLIAHHWLAPAKQTTALSRDMWQLSDDLR